LFSAPRTSHRAGFGNGTSGVGGACSTPTGPLPSANELLGALSVLQSQIASAGPLPQTHV
jgi:hypothetical protein